jgi:hypothetical protein
MKNEKSRKNGLKVKAIALLFAVFYPFTKKEKNCQNGRKVKAIALLFWCFTPLRKSFNLSFVKMDEK